MLGLSQFSIQNITMLYHLSSSVFLFWLVWVTLQWGENSADMGALTYQVFLEWGHTPPGIQNYFLMEPHTKVSMEIMLLNHKDTYIVQYLSKYSQFFNDLNPCLVLTVD